MTSSSLLVFDSAVASRSVQLESQRPSGAASLLCSHEEVVRLRRAGHQQRRADDAGGQLAAAAQQRLSVRARDAARVCSSDGPW